MIIEGIPAWILFYLILAIMFLSLGLLLKYGSQFVNALNNWTKEQLKTKQKTKQTKGVNK